MKRSPTLYEHPLLDEDLKDLAIDIRNGKVFGSWDLDRDLLHLLPSIFIALGHHTIEIPYNAGAFYQYLKYSDFHGIHGYPVFASCRILGRDDTIKLTKLILDYQANSDLSEAYV